MIPQSQNFYGVIEKPGASIADSIFLTNSQGSTMRLKDIIDKPTLVHFTHFGYQGACSKLNDGLLEILERTITFADPHYQILSISFDYRETAIQAGKMRDSLLQRAENPLLAEKAWHFFVSDSLAIHALTSSLGWEFRYSHNEITHPVATVLITPEKKISHYFYGNFFMPWHFNMALADAKNEKFTASRIKDLKFCYNQTPVFNRYTTTIIKIAAFTLLGLIAGLFSWLLVSSGRKNKL